MLTYCCLRVVWTFLSFTRLDTIRCRFSSAYHRGLAAESTNVAWVFISSHWLQQRSLGAYVSSPVSSRNVFICSMFSLCTFACEYLRFVNDFYRADHKLIVFFLKCLKQRYVSPILRTQPFVSFSESFSTFRRHFLPEMCSFALCLSLCTFASRMFSCSRRWC